MVFLTVIVILGQVAPGMKVDIVRFAGNKSFSHRVLVNIVQVKPGALAMEALLDEDARTLEAFYRNEGFFDVQVEKGLGVVAQKVVATFYIQEGVRAKVADVVFEGNRAFTAERLKRVLKFGAQAPFSLASVKAGTQSLRNLYLNTGYPFVTVEDSFERRDTLVLVRYRVAEGPRCYIRDVRVRGNRSVRTATILQSVEIKKGEMFSRRRLEEAQRRVYAMKVFSRVLFYVIPDSLASDSVVVRFDVVEGAQKGIALGVGLETPPSRALFSVEWEHNNVMNRGQWLIAEVVFSPDLSKNYRSSFDLTWRVPYLFWTRVDFQSHPFFYYERFDSARQREYGIENGLQKDIAPQLRLGLFNRLRLVADTSRGITNSLALSLIYDSRDNFFDPQRGVYFQPGLEGAGGILLGDNDFVRGVADIRVYQSLGRGFVFAVRGLGGRVIPYGRSASVPYYEEFSLGGKNNLRGYPDRALGPDTARGGRYGPVILNANVEVRSPYILRWVGVVGFIDWGQIAGQRDLKLRGFEVGAGFGLRLRTPVGPIRLDWGKRLKGAAAGDWGRIYFGVLHAF
ncbi:MAG: BamA/TamA family outer membrane protein [candidate division WOR-3 bacterium]|nr:BamA/TamA family outer membrane protein [candidate division WOR-3 bacterium]MCR4424390.1 BamA/TamA family outer membrane protein [candidate division WOR-3 bacterium]MDH7518208.1 BamA/TamA family outer membrane protein [bacterium]